MKIRIAILFLFIPFIIKGQIITTAAGTGSAGNFGDSGSAILASLSYPTGIAFDKNGNLYVALGATGNKVRKISVTGIITTVAGTGASGYTGDGGLAVNAKLKNPQDVALDSLGNLYIADATNNVIRKVDASTGIITTIAGSGVSGFSGDGGSATLAKLYDPLAICLDKFGNLYIGDYLNARVRKVTPFGLISTIAGTGISSFNGDGGLADTSQIIGASGLCSDDTGNIYIADSYSRIRKVNTFGIISTIAGSGVAGSGVAGSGGDGLSATNAEISPLRVCLDRHNSLYIVEGNGIYKIRFVNAGGIISTFAGNGTAVFGGDGGPATAAGIDYPAGAAIDSCGNVFISEVNSRRIRKVTFTSTPSATISISSSTTDTLCSGTAIIYSASVTGGGTNFAYQWRVNGLIVTGVTSNTYTYTPLNGDSINCTVTTSTPCSSPATASSNTIHTVVNPSGSPAISINASPGDTVCLGTPVTYTAGITNGGPSPAYQWVVNGINVGTGASYLYSPANGDTVRCILTSNASCLTTPTASSNNRHMVVNPLVTPTINISSSPGDTVCAGTPITFTASITGGGTSPTYQWKVNGINAGTGGSSYSYTPANGDTVRCVLTSNAACATAPTVNSNNRHMVVIPLVAPAIFITPNPNDTVCTGTAVTYTAIITGGGVSPSYQWVVNGANVGTGGSTYYYHPLDNDTVACALTSNAICASPAVIKSNKVAMVVDTFAIPAITLSGPVSAAIGSTVTITAAITDAGSVYTIYWMNSGTVFNTTSVPSVSYTKVSDTDTVTAKIVPTGGCYDSTTSLAHVVLNANAGIQDVFGSTDIQLYPNPAGDVLHIMANITLQSVAITNLLGQVVYSFAGDNSMQATINIRQLSKGIYFVKINNERVLRFVKE